MEGNFPSQTPPAPAGTGANSSGDMSCSNSVASSMESSVSSAESGPAAARNPIGVSETVTMSTVEAGSMVMESPSPPAVSIEPGNSSTIENNHGPVAPAVEPINPFDQVKEQNSNSTESSSSMNASNSSSMQGSLVENAPVEAGLSPDRPISGSNSDSSTSHQPTNPQPNPPSPSILSRATDGSSVLVNPVSNSLRNVAPPTDLLSEDDSTEPSSALTSSSPGDPCSSMDGHDTETSDSEQAERNSSVARFVGSSRRRATSTRRGQAQDVKHEHVPDIEDDFLGQKIVAGSLISGFLQKLGRNGKWQTRWFETDGECLSYYKNEKRTKLLATLDLEKVGSIVIDPEDRDGVSFNIQVLGRLYHLRADSKASCKDWVITLNRVKEARMQQGNVKLVSVPVQQPLDLLDTPAQNDDFVAPRVVVLANRQRTRAVEEEQELNQLIRLEEDEDVLKHNFKSEKRLSTIGTVVLARWTKRRSSLSRLRSKLAKWARSLRRLSCTNGDSTGLDRHVHPPGHDDGSGQKQEGSNPASIPPSSGQKKKDGLSGWIGKEASHSSRAPQTTGGLSPRSESTDIRPRKQSSSEHDIRVLS